MEATTWRCSACDNYNPTADACCAVCGADRARVPATAPAVRRSAATGQRSTASFGADRRTTVGRATPTASGPFASSKPPGTTWPTGTARPATRAPSSAGASGPGRAVTPAPAKSRAGAIGVVAVAAVVMAAILVGGYGMLPTLGDTARESGSDASTAPTAVIADPGTRTPTTTRPPATGTSTPAQQSAVGVVDIRPVREDTRAAAVAAMFDRYFSGVNTKDYRRALSVYDPAGTVDPSDPAQAAEFSRAVSTSTDSDVVIRELRDDTTGAGAVEARVSFTSHQAAGYGPKARPQQTCTKWEVTYVLTFTTGAGYRILRNSRFSNAGC